MLGTFVLGIRWRLSSKSKIRWILFSASRSVRKVAIAVLLAVYHGSFLVDVILIILVLIVVVLVSDARVLYHVKEAALWYL